MSGGVNPVPLLSAVDLEQVLHHEAPLAPGYLPAVALPVAVSELLDAFPWVNGKVDGQVWSTADAATSCTLVVPDSETSIGLLRLVL